MVKVQQVKKIIDKTTAVEKVYDDYNAFGSQISSSNLSLFSADTQGCVHNLDTLIQDLENKILTSHFKEENFQKEIEKLEKDKKFYENYIEEKTETIDTMDKILYIINEIEQVAGEINAPPAWALQKIISNYKKLDEIDLSSFVTADIHATIFDNTQLHLTNLFLNWDPLRDPYLGHDIILTINNLMKINVDNNLESPFTPILIKAWATQLTNCVYNVGNFREQSKFFSHLITHWSKVLPSTFIDQAIIAGIFIPRLNAEIDLFNPQTDLLGLHLWLSPWVVIIGINFIQIFQRLIASIVFALQQGFINDYQALIHALSPYKDNLCKDALYTFTNSVIMPLIATHINKLEFHLFNQDYDLKYIMNVLAFKKILNKPQMNIIFNSYFFPRWSSYIHHFIITVKNYPAVVNFYQTWKEKLNDEFGSFESVQNGFKNALEMMNKTIENDPSEMTGPVSQMSFKLNQETSSIRDLIELKCIQKGVTFLMIPNRYYNGKQLYKAGHLSIYIDQHVIFIYKPDTGNSEPVSLDSLIKKL